MSHYYSTKSVTLDENLLNTIVVPTNDTMVEAFVTASDGLGCESRIPLVLRCCYVTRVITGL